uniref:Uncharacterized protein n=1 Tax=Schistosoma mansoni TaxID=6183 RepID=A0A5K4EQH3_SCHMA
MDLFPLYCSLIKYLERHSLMKGFENRLPKTFREKKRLVCTIPVYLALHDLLEELGPSLMPTMYRFSKLEKILQEVSLLLKVRWVLGLSVKTILWIDIIRCV